MYKPEGVFVAMMTPFDEAGRVNETELRRMIDFQIEAGVDGLFPIGSVGESIHMSMEEKINVMQIVIQQARGRVKVAPGVGSTTPKDAIHLARRALSFGADAVVAAPPHFFPLSQEMIEKYYEDIADAVDLPVILYNIPLFSTPLSYDLIKRLGRRENIVGMKDSSGSMVDFTHFMDKIRIIGEDMHFLTGREETLFACLMMGGKGCMTATAGVLPEIMAEIYRAFSAGDYDRARKLQFSILLIVRAMFSLPFPLGFKAAMETRGFKMGSPKQPLSNAERFKYQTMCARIENIMNSII